MNSLRQHDRSTRAPALAWCVLYLLGGLAGHAAWISLAKAPRAIWFVALISPPLLGEISAWLQQRRVTITGSTVAFRVVLLLCLAAARNELDAMRFYGGIAPGENKLFFAIVGLVHVVECLAILAAVAGWRWIAGTSSRH